MNITVYAAHSETNSLADFAWFAVRSFAEISDRVIVVVAGATELQVPDSIPANVSCIVRENRGWDFASYKRGIVELDLASVDRLILCNDSVYGPFYSLHCVLSEMQSRETDFWGLTHSKELTPHIQSYFLCFGASVLRSSAFRDFWDTLPEGLSRRQAIRQGELRLTKALTAAGFAAKAYCDLSAYARGGATSLSPGRLWAVLLRRWSDPLFYYDAWLLMTGRVAIGSNPSLEYWAEAMLEQQLPFVKRSALTHPQRQAKLRAIADSIGSELALQAIAAAQAHFQIRPD